ncbi:MAG: putative serine/threonine-protein kinase chk2 [Streblomastix strix]|uniref:Putative serine/threonine-protein kinase chk2 n=1 Tax=Streblomastix strix TaxID=222440 RepID=A0A5J4VLT7_9EUKA|nr:MAG: putative serine/threonine-protein kinase chk2 [Streblomastix strix]
MTHITSRLSRQEIILQEQGFQILKFLGEGGFGQVFLVFKKEVGVVAAKIMDEKEFDLQEWQIGFQLGNADQNPFTLKYISTNLLGHQAMILMEYSNFKNLDTIIDKKVDLPIYLIRSIMKQLLQGLNIIHSKGLIHRDIKGQNILLHSPIGSGRVILKIADYGLVKQKRPNNKKSTLMTVDGTYIYMPPEFIIDFEEGVTKADYQVDIWSAGIIFYQLIVHSFPFKTSNQIAFNMFMFNRILDRPACIRDYKYDILWDLMENMLQFDRRKRISAAKALDHPFFTGKQAKSEITTEAKRLAHEAEHNGGKEITIFDKDPSYIIPVVDVKNIVGFDPEQEDIRIQRHIQPPQVKIEKRSDNVDNVLIECDWCKEEVKFSAYKAHQDEHVAQQKSREREIV